MVSVSRRWLVPPRCRISRLGYAHVTRTFSLRPGYAGPLFLRGPSPEAAARELRAPDTHRELYRVRPI